MEDLDVFLGGGRVYMTSLLSTAIVGLVVVGMVVFAVRTIRKDRREGKSCTGCGGHCSGCTACSDFLYHAPDSSHREEEFSRTDTDRIL